MKEKKPMIILPSRFQEKIMKKNNDDYKLGMYAELAGVFALTTASLIDKYPMYATIAGVALYVSGKCYQIVAKDSARKIGKTLDTLL